jgi:hypothetical protein
MGTFWLILKRDDVSICLTDPGYDINVLITADLAVFYKIWAGRISYQDAIMNYKVDVGGLPRLIQAFPSWFGWETIHVERSTL